MPKFEPHRVKVGPDIYIFRLGFKTIDRIQSDYGLPAVDFMHRCTAGDIRPNEVLIAIASAIEEINGESVRSGDLEEIAESFIDEAGFNEAINVCREIFLWGQVGRVKKQEINRASMVARMMETYISSLWTSSAKAGLLWVVTLLTSTTLTYIALTILK